MTFEEAKEYLGDAVQPDGGLYNLGWFLRFNPSDTDKCATLDGYFSADDLAAIAVFMRGPTPEHEQGGES